MHDDIIPPDSEPADLRLDTRLPPLRAVMGDRLVLLQLMQDGLTPRHLLALERAALKEAPHPR